MAATPAIATGWQGNLDLRFGAMDGATSLIHSQVKAPLKIQRPFYPEGAGVCHTVMLHTAGGVVGGDRLVINLDLEAHAQALLTTAAATKLYRSNGQTAEQIIQVNIAPHACLEWLPQETIAFNQAQYRQQMRVNLAPGALWLGWEITRFGRTARGEQFVAGDWRSHTEVWQGDRPLWLDRQWLPGSNTTVRSPHGLNGCAVVGSFALVGVAVDPELISTIREAWQGPPQAAGVTRLQLGLVCRYRGHSTPEVRRWFTAVWDIVRSRYCQRPACPPRVWQ